MAFSLISTISILGAIQGVVLLVALQRIKGGHRRANTVLSFLVALLSIMLFGQVLGFEGAFILESFPQAILIVDIPLFTFGPLLYLYVLSVLQPKGRWPKQWGAHFLPALIQGGILVFFLFESREAFNQRLQVGNVAYVGSMVALGTVHLAAYLLMCYRLSKRVRPPVAHTDVYTSYLSYLRLIISLIAVGWLVWLYSALAWFTPAVPYLPFLNYKVAWTLMSLTTFILAYFAIGQHDVFKPLKLPQKYVGSRLSALDSEQIQRRLETCMAEEKPYLDPQLTLATLAEQVGSSPKDLSRVLNEQLGVNFADFVNRYRVEAFKQLAEAEEQRTHTVLALAYDAGFNSKTAFYAAFKKFEQTTPGEYMRSRVVS